MKMPKPKDVLMKLVRIDGRLHVIRSWSSSGGYETEPLGDALARNLYVQGIEEPLTLADALIEAGWRSPDRSGAEAEFQVRAEYLQREINQMRRAMQHAGTWEQFCADYAAYTEARGG
jgi:hypothetical protein